MRTDGACFALALFTAATGCSSVVGQPECFGEIDALTTPKEKDH